MSGSHSYNGGGLGWRAEVGYYLTALAAGAAVAGVLVWLSIIF